MKKRTFTTIVFLFAALFIQTISAFGGESENQRAKTAEHYFTAKQYDKAATLYAQLVSSNPKSYKYNYYYGICLLITGKDKNQALPYRQAPRLSRCRSRPQACDGPQPAFFRI